MTMKEYDPVIVLVTSPDREKARIIATNLIKRKLAACVNILPGIESIYEWEGSIQDDQEVQLFIKTRGGLLEGDILPLIQDLHPYDLPEIIVVPIIGGSQPYLDWIITETSK